MFEMLFPLFAVLAIGVWLLIGATAVTYVVRTWQKIRSERDGSDLLEVLDRIDQLQMQITLLSERLLERSEETGGRGLEPGRGGDE